MALTALQIDALAHEHETLTIRMAADKRRLDEVKDQLAALPFGSLATSDHELKISVQHNRRRDDAAFMAAYPFEKFPELYKPALDTAAIKHEIAPADLEPFTVESTPKVIVTRFETGD